MDVVILPSHAGVANGVPKPPGLFSNAGILRLNGLLSYLAERGCQSGFYMVCPKGSLDLVALLLEFVSGLGAIPPTRRHFILDISDLRGEVLEAAAAGRIGNLIASAGKDPVHDRAAHRAISDYYKRHSREELAIHIWIEPTYGTADLSRMRAFAKSGIDLRSITEPMLPMNGAQAVPFRSASMPAELLDSPMLCELYANTLTFDADGEARACNRHSAGGALGNLFEHSPEDLIYWKGWHANREVSSDVCRSCSVRGRYLWARQQSEVLARLFRIGADAGEEFAEAGSGCEPVRVMAQTGG